MREIIIDVTPFGEIQLEAVGFKGKDCEKYTQAFEKALGQVKGKKKKPEYYQVATGQQRQTT